MGVKQRKQTPTRSNEQQQQQQQKQKQQVGIDGEKGDGGWGDWLFDPIDAKPLAMLRILWGLVLVLEMYTFMKEGFLKSDTSFFDLKNNLPYYGFQWLPKLTLPQSHILLTFCLFSAIGVTVGFLYHFSMLCFLISFGFVYFYEASTYLNHLYLLLIIGLTFGLLPCNARYSVDSYLFPSVYSTTVPRWTRIIVYILLCCVYGHAAQAKVNRDWLRAEPLRHWLPKRVRLYGPLLGQESFAYFLSYSGIFYDAIAAPLLIYRPTRTLGIIFNVFFHVTNKIIFSIGIFPYMMLAFLVLFVDLSFLDALYVPKLEEGEEVVVDRKGKVLRVVRRGGGRKHKAGTMKKWAVIVLLVSYGGFQLFFPLRHHIYPGYVAWNEYGHLYSWRMKLRDKNCEITEVIAQDPRTGTNFSAMQVWKGEFSKRQHSAMRSRPDFLSFGAHVTSKAIQELTQIDAHVPVFITAQCQLNFGPLTPFTDPGFDMASHETFNWPYPWLLPEPDLPAELQKDYPWNFEWSFSWITTFPECHLSDNNPLYAKGYTS